MSEPLYLFFSPQTTHQLPANWGPCDAGQVQRNAPYCCSVWARSVVKLGDLNHY